MALLRPSEVEKEYGLSLSTLYRYVKSKKLSEHRTSGGHRRFDSKELNAMMKSRNNRKKARK